MVLLFLYGGMVIGATHAKLLAHAGAKDQIEGIDRGLKAGDVIKVGKTVELECLDTPGHTMSHICVVAHDDRPALFCGDTLFNAGAGNCHNGGHPNELYNTFAAQLSKLPDETLIYPGHDYIAKAAAFARAQPPVTNASARADRKSRADGPGPRDVTTLGIESRSTSFRLQNAEVIRQLRARVPVCPTTRPGDVFLALRELRSK
jgi:hydroxyacylglutathione hydrolase